MKPRFSHLTWRWILASLLFTIPALAFAWWGNQDYPETFPTQAEELDRTLYVQGGHLLFPDRYDLFHQRLLETRNTWRNTVNQWWTTKDGAAFQQTYQELLNEGTTLLEAIRQKSLALRMEVEDLIRPEHEQVARLRSLTHLFEMGPDTPGLSRAEGLLNEATKRLETGQFGKARLATEEAIASLREVEEHMLEQMRRYTDEEQLALWNQWVNHTIRWSTATGGTAIIVLKAPRRLFLYRRGQVLAEYPVDLGFSGLLDKQYEGDGATPEGRFRLIRKKSGSETKFYRALLLDYPSPEHRLRFQELQALGEIPPGKTIGGAIEIHGKTTDSEDQTSGCVAMENEAIEQVFQNMSQGEPITIVGALNTNNEVVDILHALEEHIQLRETEQQAPTSLSAALYAVP
ncbi:MAG: murein L,D-transpeptidase family protein [Nitrospirales bacterium]